MNNKQNNSKLSAAELLNKGETIVWEKSNTLYMPRYYKMDQGKVFYTDAEHNFKWLESTSTIEDFTESFNYVTKSDYENIEKNNQLQEFLTEYASGNVMIADAGVIEEIEQSNQHFTLTITHEVLTSDIVQYITFKQHENYTQGDEYNELSDVFDYENVFSVTMVDGEVIEIEEKTNEKADTNMINLLAHVKEYLVAKGNKEEQKKEMEYIMKYGCQSGTVSHLIYYSNTVAFYQEHKEEINELLYETLWDNGVNISELFENWEKEDPLALDDNNQNILAWFGFEEAVYKLYNEIYE